MKETVMDWKEKSKPHWLSYFQIACKC